jgi:hypothetical protein
VYPSLDTAQFFVWVQFFLIWVGMLNAFHVDIHVPESTRGSYVVPWAQYPYGHTASLSPMLHFLGHARFISDQSESTVHVDVSLFHFSPVAFPF